jgi:hypothetical protein
MILSNIDQSRKTPGLKTIASCSNSRLTAEGRQHAGGFLTSLSPVTGQVFSLVHHQHPSKP